MEFSLIGKKSVLLLSVILFTRSPAPADELAVNSNQLLAAQLMDVATTRTIVSQGGFERDPLFQPYVHSTTKLTLIAVGLNVAARLLFKHSPKTIRLFTLSECVMVGNNFAVLNRMR